MDRSRFDTSADRLRADAKVLQSTAEGCLAPAIRHLSGENPTGLAGASPDESGACVTLGQVSRKIEDVMAVYDQLQEVLGGAPRFEPVLEQLGARPGPGASDPTASNGTS